MSTRAERTHLTDSDIMDRVRDAVLDDNVAGLLAILISIMLAMTVVTGRSHIYMDLTLPKREDDE